MIPPIVGIQVGGAAELAHGQHHGGVQQPALLQVLQQGGKGLVQGGSQIVPQPLVVVLVGVPGPVSVSGGGHKAAAGFHQATSQQHALTDSGASVGLLGPVRLLGQIEGLLDAGRKQHG